MATVGQRRKKWKLALSITVTLLGQIWLLVKSSKWLQLQNHPDDWAVLSRIEFEARKGVSKRGSNDLGEQKNKKVKNEPNENRYDDSDQHCIFRDSPIYRSVFVYPSPGENEWQGDILTPHGKVRTNLYPWQEIDNRTKTLGEFHYRIRDARANQYTTEILVREILTNPNSCLRTLDPEQAKLFYVPYMPSLEWHNGSQFPKSFETSPFGQAIMDAIDGNFIGWETIFGWTSTFWKRRNGSDHILVMSEPCHGLWHPRLSPGNFVYIHAQKQLAPPIVISKDISRTFVEMYPFCHRKNIVMPHPNPDGRWFNSRTDRMAKTIAEKAGMLSVLESPAALSSEKELVVSNRNDQQQRTDQPRILAQYYKAGKHGTCMALRTSLDEAFGCSPSNQLLTQRSSMLPKGFSYPHAFRQSTFCPCPGGDAPSAKRMFDALFAGCIPVVLSEDFVWPFTKEAGSQLVLLDPNTFSIRLKSDDYTLQDPCGADRSRSLQTFLEKNVSAAEVLRLRKGVHKAAQIYAYYQRSKTLPDNPLQHSVLPDGGAALALVTALAKRAGGVLWPECEEELKKPRKQDPTRFKC